MYQINHWGFAFKQYDNCLKIQAKLSQTWINSELEKSVALQLPNRRDKNQAQTLASRSPGEVKELTIFDYF